jgi:diguanylate cyclase (GGDEF)-like protein
VTSAAGNEVTTPQHRTLTLHAVPGISTALELPAPRRPSAPRILLVEDSAGDARLVTEMLHESGRRWEITHVTRLRAALDVLAAQSVDCVLLDLSLPDADELDALHALERSVPDAPVVVLTHHHDETIATQALAHGAQDFLSKRILTPELLARSLKYAIERKAAELRFSHQASHDPLTGLPNRSLFDDRLRVALADRHRPIAVLFVDLDDFKLVNDAWGHQAGDLVLASVAERLVEAVRPSDTVARFAGDEFTVLCPRLPDVEEALRIAERIVEEVPVAVQLGGRGYQIRCSVGVTVSTMPDDDSPTLLSQADAALYHAKAQGKNRYAPYDASLRIEAMQRLTVQRQLVSAMDRDQFRLAYQPEVDLVTGRVAVVEALLRWEHPTRGLLMPDTFIARAESSGLITGIGAWVLEQALQDRKQWHRTGRFGATTDWAPVVAVNASPVQLSEIRFAESVAAALERTGSRPESLQLEITESALLERATIAETIGELRQLGVGIAIDDFGTGFSSLNYLKLFPATAVKIDKSFVDGLGVDRLDEALVAAVISVAQAAGLTAVAEGVETREQRAILTELGCDLGQGYLFARPS